MRFTLNVKWERQESPRGREAPPEADGDAMVQKEPSRPIAQYLELQRSELVSCSMIDQWTETLECPKCGKVGSANLSQDMSDEDSVPIVHFLSGHFKVDQQRDAPAFYCEACNVWAKP